MNKEFKFKNEGRHCGKRFCCVTAVEKSVRESAQLHVQYMVQRVFGNQ